MVVDQQRHLRIIKVYSFTLVFLNLTSGFWSELTGIDSVYYDSLFNIFQLAAYNILIDLQQCCSTITDSNWLSITISSLWDRIFSGELINCRLLQLYIHLGWLKGQMRSRRLREEETDCCVGGCTSKYRSLSTEWKLHCSHVIVYCVTDRGLRELIGGNKKLIYNAMHS